MIVATFIEVCIAALRTWTGEDSLTSSGESISMFYFETTNIQDKANVVLIGPRRCSLLWYVSKEIAGKHASTGDEWKKRNFAMQAQCPLRLISLGELPRPLAALTAAVPNDALHIP